MLDTDVCVELIRGRGARIEHRMAQCGPAALCISAITLAELEVGVEKSHKYSKNRDALDEFCVLFDVLDFGRDAANEYGRVRAKLESRGKIIGGMDLLIAAHCLAEGATLVTNNTREFSRVEGLRVENWS